jgi:SAM-dependent methyltransferase
MTQDAKELETIYSQRFEGRQEYRNRVWQVLIDSFFRKFVAPDSVVLDLGCGYGEFINQIRCRTKYGMDLNPATARLLGEDVHFLQQDCSTQWPLPENSLDVVFTSNFFEHLPNKQTLGSTLEQAHRCLKPGGKLIAMGPNIRCVPGAYWDFWDHFLELTELSLSEGMQNRGFEIELCRARFLPYTMVNAPQYPLLFLRVYLALPILWSLAGKQFLVIGACRKRDHAGASDHSR